MQQLHSSRPLPCSLPHPSRAISRTRDTSCNAHKSGFRRALFGCIPLVEGLQSKTTPHKSLLASMKEAFHVWSGGAAPAMPVTISKDPGSIYVQYSLEEHQRALIEKQLPEGLELASIQTTANTEKKPQLTLNAYHIEGSVVKGCRMELSVYVQHTAEAGNSSPDHQKPVQPFYMILQAWCDQPSYDPTRGFTSADALTMTSDDDGIHISLKQTDQPDLHLQFLPTDKFAISSSQWARANERCYWTNGDFDHIDDTTPFLEQQYQQTQLTLAQGHLPFIDAIEAPLSALLTTEDIQITIRPEL